MVKSHLEALQARAGEAGFDRAMATLSEADRAELLVVTAISWVRIASVEALYGAVAPTQGKAIGDFQQLTELSTTVGDSELTTNLVDEYVALADALLRELDTARS